jgi:RNA polymerase sigma-70 factor (ECF subfamily)
VNTAAINMPLTSDLPDSAHSATPEKAVAENAELEELAALFQNHHRAIFRIAYRITGSRSDAEDVLQTIFLRLTPSRRDLSPNPEGYLHRAAVNASLDLIRSRARRNSVPLDVIDFDKSPKLSVASPEDDFADVELRELIRQAVAKLEGRAATAFALRYFEGCDNARIAQILGTSQMVVAVTLHRARTRLRKEIGNYLEKHHEAQ